ncbi:hypothetical protein D8Y22_08065 [Salinadaptatus halalkaliphilus]|uniref:Uncharacterized protein n=1 Tax=Salinadaptatus halalkaliphilus TaxID=2419781 RepID=A0A4S3TM49_9EURY|nr:hypothetical protein [Salinadaptatus halalkaliphilus]THE65166.1 hypothetical protein D8Y22_08065 [Salinadaptatus halalkaliphilus]
MAIASFRSLFELFRAAPAKSVLLAGGPLVLACGQLLNSYVNGLSPLVAIGFAAGMVAFAVVATRHHAAELRLEALEADLEGTSQSGAYADSSD